jgi:hypothetical protein
MSNHNGDVNLQHKKSTDVTGTAQCGARWVMALHPTFGDVTRSDPQFWRADPPLR